MMQCKNRMDLAKKAENHCLDAIGVVLGRLMQHLVSAGLELLLPLCLLIVSRASC